MKFNLTWILSLLLLIGAFSFKVSNYTPPIKVGGASTIVYQDSVDGEPRVTMDFPILVVSDGTWPVINSRTATIDDTTDLRYFMFQADNSAFMRAMKYPDPSNPEEILTSAVGWTASGNVPAGYTKTGSVLSSSSFSGGQFTMTFASGQTGSMYYDIPWTDATADVALIIPFISKTTPANDLKQVRPQLQALDAGNNVLAETSTMAVSAYKYLDLGPRTLPLNVPEGTTKLRAFLYNAPTTSTTSGTVVIGQPQVEVRRIEVVNYRFSNANGVGPWIALGEDTDEGCTGITNDRGILSRWTHGTPQYFCQPVKTGSAAGEITTGSTTIQFMLPIAADSLTSGYSIPKADFLREGYTYTRNSFFEPGYFTNTVWQGDQSIVFNYVDEAYTVLTSTDAKNRGKEMVRSYALIDSKGVNEDPINSSCITCHERKAALDILAIWSPYEAHRRAMFHGMPSAEADTLVAGLTALVDSVGLFEWGENRPGRRWYQIYAAQPGADTLSAIERFAGVSIDQTLNDDQMYQEMFGALATFSDLDWRNLHVTQNPREKRGSVPLFTWAKWLPRMGMDDLLGSRATWRSDECYTQMDVIEGKINTWLTTGNESLGVIGLYRDFGILDWQKNKCESTDATYFPGDQTKVPWLSQLGRASITAFQGNNIIWDMLRIQDNGHSLIDSVSIKLLPPDEINGETDQTVGLFGQMPQSYQTTFIRAPHRLHTSYNKGETSIHYSSYSGYSPSVHNYTGGPTESAQWYDAYRTHNVCYRYRRAEPTPCDDHKYTQDHLRTLANQGPTFGEAAYIQNLVGIGALTNYKGILDGGGRFPRHDWIHMWLVPGAYGNVNGCGDWTPTQCRTYYDAVFEAWFDVYKVYSRSDIPAGRQEPTSNILYYGSNAITTSGTWVDPATSNTVTTPTCRTSAASDPTSNSLYDFDFSTADNYAVFLKCALTFYGLVGGRETLADSINDWGKTMYAGSGSNNFLVDATFASLPLPGDFTLSAPADAATDQALSVTLTWNASSDATTYTLQYDDDSGFGSPVTVTGIVGTSYQPNFDPSTQGNTYYWRVQGVNATGSGNYTTSRSFTLLTPVAWGFKSNLFDYGTFSEAGDRFILTDTAGVGDHDVYAFYGPITDGEIFTGVVDSVNIPKTYYNNGFGFVVADTSTTLDDGTVQFIQIRQTRTRLKVVWRYAGQEFDSVRTINNNPKNLPTCQRFDVVDSAGNWVITPQWAYEIGGSCGPYNPVAHYKPSYGNVKLVIPNTVNLVTGALADSRTITVDVKGYGKNANIQ